MRTRKGRINVQKMIASIMLVVVLFVAIPRPVQADENGFVQGVLLKPLVQLVASLGDIFMGVMNHFMLGTEKIAGSVMLDKTTRNVDEGSLAVSKIDTNKAVTRQVTEKLDGTLLGDWKLPNMLYCPENIFANKIAALDINFINPHHYKVVQPNSADTAENDDGKDSEEKDDGKEEEDESNTKESIAESLNGIISSWYRAFRNIAIVGLLSVLIYIGIRILIESTAQGKAKYREKLMDWVVAFCLVFVMQYIMSGTLMISEKITQLFETSGSTNVIVELAGENSGEELGQSKTNKFATNLTGYIRFMAQRDNLFDCAAYTIIYVALVIFTVKFTFTYLKRVLYMAFFTMISPLVALTYPLDKMADGKAQAFDLWLREYMMNAILQPVHLILYTVLVSSAIDLAVDNPIYALVAIWFLVPAEKFIKKMFRLDRGQTTSGFGDFAAGAVTMSALKKLGSSNVRGSKGSSSSKEDDSKIRTKTPIKENDVKDFSGFKHGNGDEEDQGADETPQFLQSGAADETPQFLQSGAADEFQQLPGETNEQYEARIRALLGGGHRENGGNEGNEGNQQLPEETDEEYAALMKNSQRVDSSEEDLEKEQPEENPEEEDTRTLGEWFGDEYGWTPASVWNDTKSSVKSFGTGVQSRLKSTASGAVRKLERSNIRGLNRIPGAIRNIPTPVKNSIRGVRQNNN